MNLKGKHIFLLSTEFWGAHYLSKHHYALALKELGNEVYFIQPGKEKGAQAAGESPEGIQLIDFKPSSGQRYLPKTIARKIQAQEWKKIVEIAQHPPDLIWSFDNSRLFHLDALGNEVKSIHHVVDLNQDFELAAAASSADLCLGSTRFIVDRLKKHQEKSYFLHHGCVARPCSKKPLSSPIKMAYLGNILLRFVDRDFLIQMIAKFPEIEFHFIGGYTQNNLIHEISVEDEAFIKTLNKANKVFLHGSVEQNKLSNLMEEMDAFFIAYAKAHYEQAANPHKVMELLSTGKAVLSFPIDAFLDQELLHFADTRSDFFHLIEDLRQGRLPDRFDQQLAFTASHSYQAQIAKIEEWIKHW
ncbi:MAG: hypothetical protein NWQ53_09715 [Flavobacteriales bacterium]|nr:hypothetical protein [Flavobacteriales bacterium]